LMKKIWWTVIVVVAVVVLGVLMINRGDKGVSAETAQCIAENSVLYIQYGCHACAIQEDMFGDSYKYLNVVDCFYDMDECIEKGIEATPTWIIDGVKYRSVQEIGNLRVLTGCELD
jgi:hypothetical protein